MLTSLVAQFQQLRFPSVSIKSRKTRWNKTFPNSQTLEFHTPDMDGEYDAHDVGMAFLARVGLALLSVWRWVGVVVEGEGADAPVG